MGKGTHRGGHVMHLGNGTPSLESRLGAKVQIQPSGCWAYNGNLDKYHHVNLPATGTEHRKQVPAHRWFYETLVGPIEDGLHLHHRCEKPGCVNPDHLVPLTNSEHQAEHHQLRRSSSRGA
jgi:hypothetical protein